MAHFETVRRRRDGTRLDVSLTISPIRGRDGGIIGASKIMRDISDRKRVEQRLRQTNVELGCINAELDEFVYTASHDLRAPLSNVGAVAQWILEDDQELSTQTRDRLLLIQSRIARMNRLLNDIRDYARSGDYDKPSGPRLSAEALVLEVLAASSVPPGFSVHANDRLQGVEVQRMPLEQVLQNLIGNAFKHHDRPTGQIEVSVEAGGPMLKFSVIDDGPGIPQQYREEIFGMFKTLRPRDTVEGSGMGLALVRRIVGRMGGSCGVEPAAGRGSHFWFDWPRIADQRGGPA